MLNNKDQEMTICLKYLGKISVICVLLNVSPHEVCKVLALEVQRKTAADYIVFFFFFF